MIAAPDIEAMVEAARLRHRLLRSADVRERVQGAILTFEAGCGNTVGQPPERCPECVRTFVDALKGMVGTPPSAPQENRPDAGV